jgi:hypothetical protein
MPNIYCPSCGSGIKFLYEKPKSCTNCKFVFAVPIKLEKEEKEKEDDKESMSFRKLPKKKTSLKDIKITIEKITPIKLSSVLGSDPNNESFKRKGLTKEEFKQQIFKSGPISLDDDQI